MKSSFRAALAVGALALASSQAIASSVPWASFNVTTGPNFAVTSPSQNPIYVELLAGANDILTKFTLIDTNVEGKTVSYALFNDNDVSTNSYVLGTAVGVPWSFVDLAGNGGTYAATLLAGQQYVLKIQHAGVQAFSSTTEISAVPLPAAAWLFGSALMGFGALRRKQKAGEKSEMAAA